MQHYFSPSGRMEIHAFYMAPTTVRGEPFEVLLSLLVNTVEPYNANRLACFVATGRF